MTAFFNLTKNSFWKVSKNLIRDFRELELMQSTNQTALNRFITNSQSKAKETLLKEFQYINFTSIFFEEDTIPTSDGVHILIYSLEGMDNLRRSFPFFCNAAVQIKINEGKKQVIASILSFPGLGQVFYAENGNGAWMEKYEDRSASSVRLRASGAKEITMVNPSYLQYSEKEYDSRNFSSIFYDIALFASGKFDAIIIESSPEILKLSAELFAKESGGYVKDLDNDRLLMHGSSIKI